MEVEDAYRMPCIPAPLLVQSPVQIQGPLARHISSSRRRKVAQGKKQLDYAPRFGPLVSLRLHHSLALRSKGSLHGRPASYFAVTRKAKVLGTKTSIA